MKYSAPGRGIVIDTDGTPTVVVVPAATPVPVAHVPAKSLAGALAALKKLHTETEAYMVQHHVPEIIANPTPSAAPLVSTPHAINAHKA